VSCLILKVKALQISVRITTYFKIQEQASATILHLLPGGALVWAGLSNLLKCLAFKYLLFLNVLRTLPVLKMQQIVPITLKQTIISLF
jgi:hypothetical protein